MPVRIDAAGTSGPPRKVARGKGWRRTSHGFYVPSDVSNELVEQRIAEASVLVPPGCAITGWAALRWCGGRWFEGTTASGDLRPVVIAVGTADIRKQPGVEPSGEGLNARMVTVIDGVPVTLSVYSVSFEMRYAESDRAAAAVLDLAAYSDLVSIEEQSAFLTPGQNGWTGVPRARRGVPMADENTWSPREPWMRFLWEAEPVLGRPLCNRPLFDLDGRHIGTPDLIDPRSGVAGEYEGGHHLAGEQRAKDVVREAHLRDHGLESVTMLAGDTTEPTGFLRRLHAAYARARLIRPEDRRWTLEQPSWWVPAGTVAQRRALSEDQRERFLRYRRAS